MHTPLPTVTRSTSKWSSAAALTLFHEGWTSALSNAAGRSSDANKTAGATAVATSTANIGAAASSAVHGTPHHATATPPQIAARAAMRTATKAVLRKPVIPDSERGLDGVELTLPMRCGFAKCTAASFDFHITFRDAFGFFVFRFFVFRFFVFRSSETSDSDSLHCSASPPACCRRKE